MNKNIIYTLFMTIDKWPSSTQTPGDFSIHYLLPSIYEICMGFDIERRKEKEEENKKNKKIW